MARRPLAYTPDGPVWEDDLDLTWKERGKVLAGFLVVIGFICLMCLAGGGQ